MSAKQSASPNEINPTRVLRRFRVVFNAVRTQFREMERQVGLGGAQVWALSLIQSNPGMGVGDVSRQMDIHQSTASNLVKQLLSKELITLEKSKADRRSVHLHCTPTGKQLLFKVSGPFEGVLPDALAKLSSSTLQRLDHDLGELISLLQADESAETTPLADI